VVRRWEAMIGLTREIRSCAGREHGILVAIVCTGFAARAFAIWLCRPEFVGWFNHSYYYWVQVEGLLADGRLPHADLPFAFILYAGVASAFRLFGMETGPAVVNASRCVMSLAPALVAVPVYGLAKGIHRGLPLGPSRWTLVALSAFLPLTLAHVPELLQKNCLGLLFLAALMLATQAHLRTRSTASLIGCLIVYALIAVTHIGTLAVALLFGLSSVLALLHERAVSGRSTRWLAGLLGVFGTGLMAVYLLDVGAFQRILLYARSSVPFGRARPHH